MCRFNVLRKWPLESSQEHRRSGVIVGNNGAVLLGLSIVVKFFPAIAGWLSLYSFSELSRRWQKCNYALLQLSTIIHLVDPFQLQNLQKFVHWKVHNRSECWTIQPRFAIARRRKRINPGECMGRAIAAHQRRQRSLRWHDRQRTWETIQRIASDSSIEPLPTKGIPDRINLRTYSSFDLLNSSYIYIHPRLYLIHVNFSAYEKLIARNARTISRWRARSSEKRSSWDTLTIGQFVRDCAKSFQFRLPASLACKQDQGRDFSNASRSVPEADIAMRRYERTRAKLRYVEGKK